MRLESIVSVTPNALDPSDGVRRAVDRGIFVAHVGVTGPSDMTDDERWYMLMFAARAILGTHEIEALAERVGEADALVEMLDRLDAMLDEVDDSIDPPRGAA